MFDGTVKGDDDTSAAESTANEVQPSSGPSDARNIIVLSVALVALDLSKADREDVAVSDTVYTVGDLMLAVQSADHAQSCLLLRTMCSFCFVLFGIHLQRWHGLVATLSGWAS